MKRMSRRREDKKREKKSSLLSEMNNLKVVVAHARQTKEQLPGLERMREATDLGLLAR